MARLAARLKGPLGREALAFAARGRFILREVRAVLRLLSAPHASAAAS